MLKELEGLVLGYVFKTGPCTAYQIRKLLRSSPSSQWRGSAGSIYPLLERLERIGLIEGKDDEDDLRARRLLGITRSGKQALKAWVKAGAKEDLVSAISDPVRTRIFFLDVLTSRERTKLLADMLLALEEFLAYSESDLSLRLEDGEPGHHGNYLGALGAVMTNQARVAYLRRVAKAIESKGVG